jgi:amino acid adenylation domain-containing protein
MQGTWAVLLGIYSQNTDIVFGVTVSGRPPELKGVEDMIGLFINSLPVRVQINPAKKIQQFLVELMENQVENDRYSYTPLVTIHGCSNVPSRLPLFNSILVFENYPLDATIDEQAEKLSIRNLQIHEQTNFPLTITASGGKQIPIKISFDESIIAIENIELMGVHFENLLRYLCRNSDATISAWMANALTPNESFQLIETLNESSQLFIEDQYTLPDLFELQAKKHEDKVALCMGQDYLTYDELNKRANQLARNLQNLGAEPGDLIGVCLNRSPLLIISLLAIQKLGAAYLPIDPDYPSQRIAYMLKDAQVRILLNDSHSHKDIVSTIPNCQLLEIDLETLDKLTAENIEIKRSPLAPAYVIYTSGSTGNPKGVQISQSALVNFLLSMRERPGMNLNDKLLSVTTISFDIAGLEIYLPLIVGGQIILVDRDVSSDGSTLLTTIQNSGATIMQATPVTWRLLYEAGWDGIGLEQVWCGGEAFPLDLATKLQNTNAVVWNLYGPTETTIWSTRFLLSSHQELKNNVPIGRPISNTQLFILDKQRNLLPKVVAGELFIGGNGLANCYLNRPSLTAEKFTPNPFSESRGSRLYATGDIARYQSDGNLICMGRIDQQIKLRGFRIELGEIEACLQNYEEIKQVVVQVVELAKDDQRLVAYLSVHNDASFEVGNVQNWLRNQLPHHLIPSEWMVLDNFPLTPNGKLDKKSLPHPTRPTNIDYIGPASPTEEILEKLMSEVLNLKQVSSIADFFDLGGHSLLATKLAARIKQQFDLNISLPILFERANIKQLGEYIDNLQWTSQNNSEVSSPLNDEEEEFKL